jgi:hydroxymethylpyrimidine/phosphomethylpyrimidine kinase
LFDGQEHTLLRGPKISSRNTHGTGCTLSSAIAALLAQGYGVKESVERAKRYIIEAIRTAPDLGHGAGPLNHFV